MATRFALIPSRRAIIDRRAVADRLAEAAWSLFGASPPGWARVQAVCDFVHRHITFGYAHARPTKTAWEAFQERAGVCRTRSAGHRLDGLRHAVRDIMPDLARKLFRFVAGEGGAWQPRASQQKSLQKKSRNCPIRTF